MYTQRRMGFYYFLRWIAFYICIVLCFAQKRVETAWTVFSQEVVGLNLLNLSSWWVTLTGPPWSDRVVIPSYEPHKTNWGERIKPRTDFDLPSFSSPSKLNNYILLTMMILIGILIWNLGAVKTWDRVEIATSRLIVKIFPQMPAIFKCIGFIVFKLSIC